MGSILSGTERASSVANSTRVVANSITDVPAGTYLVVGRLSYSASTSGVRQISISTSSSYAQADAAMGASPMWGSNIMEPKFITLTSTGTIYLIAYQNSGGSLDISSSLQAYKLD